MRPFLLLGVLCTSTACDKERLPPSSDLFTPQSGHHFEAKTGVVYVDMDALDGARVCFTTDNSDPQLTDGECDGAEEYAGEIQLSCGDATGADTVRQVKIIYEWPSYGEQHATATYRLDCSPDAPASDPMGATTPVTTADASVDEPPPADSDEDGVPDPDDNCPSVPNADQADDNGVDDGSGPGDACEAASVADADKDGREDDFDNCIDVWNADQADEDEDGVGNVCDETPLGALQQGWVNQEMALAVIRALDQIRCDIRCTDPTGGGDVGTIDCTNGGTANWRVDVALLAGRADSTFTYDDCDYVTEEGDRVVLAGEMFQFSDFSGNGTEAGTISVAGDFTGSFTSNHTFSSRTRDGGYVDVSCTAHERQDLSDLTCAPDNLSTRHNYPDYACAGAECPMQSTEPLVDSDGDGVFDRFDNCPDDANADQANADADELGDVCDAN